MRDERYLPFEGADLGKTIEGVASDQNKWRINGSRWNLQLSDIPSFDYDTITDVILHLRYTAIEGSQSSDVLKELQETIIDPEHPYLFSRLFSLRTDFPDVWRKIENDSIQLPPQSFPITLLKDRHFPYFLRAFPSSKITIENCQFWQESKADHVPVGDQSALGPLGGPINKSEISGLTITAEVLRSVKKVELLRDIWIECSYSIAP